MDQTQAYEPAAARPDPWNALEVLWDSDTPPGWPRLICPWQVLSFIRHPHSTLSCGMPQSRERLCLCKVFDLEHLFVDRIHLMICATLLSYCLLIGSPLFNEQMSPDVHHSECRKPQLHKACNEICKSAFLLFQAQLLFCKRSIHCFQALTLMVQVLEDMGSELRKAKERYRWASAFGMLCRAVPCCAVKASMENLMNPSVL